MTARARARSCRERFLSVVVATAFVLAGLTACAASSTSAAPALVGPPAPPAPAIAAAHRARCAQCHVRVDPGQRTREALTVALARHRNRVHLSEPQWAALIDYLAPASP